MAKPKKGWKYEYRCAHCNVVVGDHTIIRHHVRFEHKHGTLKSVQVNVDYTIHQIPVTPNKKLSEITIEGLAYSKKQKDKGVAIYHRVSFDHDFNQAAHDLFNLVKTTVKKFPKKKRFLYIDIDGHKNNEGGYDKDMFELQKEFATNVLLPYVTRLHIPLLKNECMVNTKIQRDDFPDELQITSH